MSEPQTQPEAPPEARSQKPEARTPLLFKEDSHHGESRWLNISLRGWIALFVVLTFCIVCLSLTFRIADPKEAAGVVKDLFVPTLMLVVTFYFATKPNNPNAPKP
jgi:hypothetical protein